MYLPVYIAEIHLCFYLKIEIPITGEQEPGSPAVRGLPLANKAVVCQR